ncbi:winged helix-turn-helix transcriptional regulator [Rosenbergiella australiborealis]|uniref:Helix-turn-helix transcriptional regulator n=1 Tax=Rosenbergiella australiborealis TaxID=1544696 RepID=A0ABS5T4E3_9GAMM|nr:helix-turn-helix domain-containing protein [Rosenbergiella australiborealis]MBT0727220.1 helix-turn-helix transcriptional regulator [Rosenbergiella australiborealis]
MDTTKRARYDSYEAPACPVEASLELIGGKGKGILLYHLLEGKLRFNELGRRTGGMTARMLTKQLRELEFVGLVRRDVYPEIPPKVEYSLTAAGVSLTPLLHLLKEWGEQHAIELLNNLKTPQ